MSDIIEKLDVKVVTKKKLQPPKLFNVVFLNDDKTPMDFVVEMLVSIFRQPRDEAVCLMLEIHHSDKGRVGPYCHEVAEQRLLDAKAKVAEHGHPLTLDMEEA